MSANVDGQHPDLLSTLTELDLVRFLLADLHNDLEGKIGRFRQLTDLFNCPRSRGHNVVRGRANLHCLDRGEIKFH
jgi:hypothetical protein